MRQLTRFALMALLGVAGAVSAQTGTPVPPRVAGPDLGRPSANLSLLPLVQAADEENPGARQVTVRQMQRIELDLRASSDVCGVVCRLCGCAR